METKTSQAAVEVVTAAQAAKIIGCSRPYIFTLQLKGVLQPYPTPTPKLFFRIEDVEKAKSLLLKNKRNEKA